jgi:RNA polymerase sigma-70 factor (ECF subfamily)
MVYNEKEYLKLYRKAKHALKERSLILTQNEFDADDLLQETVFKTITKLNLFKEGSNFTAWALRIMYNTFVSNYRRNKYRHTALTLDKSGEIEALKVHENATLELTYQLQSYAVECELGDEILEALSDLPEQQRSVIYLCDIYGLSYKEIQEAVNAPGGTVMSRIHRAREALVKTLNQYAIDNGYKIEK